MHKTSAWPLALIYGALIVYASLYPFADWRDQGIAPWAFLAAPLPRYWTGFDVVANVLGYAPLGFLLALSSLRGHGAGRLGPALGLGALAAGALSLVMETLQSYLPARVPSNVDFALNVAGALVHFVDEGMLLVSPRIFREFAERYGEDGSGSALACAAGEADIGLFIQRQVLQAGWHLRTDQGVNFLTYQVMRGKRAVSRLSGVVIPNPARFVDPVPPVNPLLVRLVVEPGET